MLPLAHVGHYLWVLYLLPVVFVLLGILKTILGERRRDPDDPQPRSDSSRGGDDPPEG